MQQFYQQIKNNTDIEFHQSFPKKKIEVIFLFNKNNKLGVQTQMLTTIQ